MATTYAISDNSYAAIQSRANAAAIAKGAPLPTRAEILQIQAKNAARMAAAPVVIPPPQVEAPIPPVSTESNLAPADAYAPVYTPIPPETTYYGDAPQSYYTPAPAPTPTPVQPIGALDAGYTTMAGFGVSSGPFRKRTRRRR